MGDAEGWRFSDGLARMTERAIIARVPDTVVEEGDSVFVPGARSLKVSHERASWTLEIVPLHDEFLICLSGSLALFSQEDRFDRARRGLSASAVDWVVETVERALRSGVVVVRRRRGATDIFLGDEVEDLERESRSGAEVIRRLSPIASR